MYVCVSVCLRPILIFGPILCVKPWVKWKHDRFSRHLYMCVCQVPGPHMYYVRACVWRRFLTCLDQCRRSASSLAGLMKDRFMSCSGMSTALPHPPPGPFFRGDADFPVHCTEMFITQLQPPPKSAADSPTTWTHGPPAPENQPRNLVEDFHQILQLGSPGEEVKTGSEGHLEQPVSKVKTKWIWSDMVSVKCETSFESDINFEREISFVLCSKRGLSRGKTPDKEGRVCWGAGLGWVLY